jgi:hypothetical protein
VSRHLGPDELESSLRPLLDRAERLRINRPTSLALYGWARLAFALAEAGRTAGRDDASDAAAALVSCLEELQRPDGSLPTTSDARDRAPTGQIAQFAVAADAAGRMSSARAAVEFLVDRRGTGDNGLVLSADDVERTESSAWVALALMLQAEGRARLEATLAPPIEPLPDYEIIDVTPGPEQLVYLFRAGPRLLERRFNAAHFDHLLGRVVDYLARNPLARSSRQHGHAAIALRALLASTADNPTRERLITLLDAELGYILDAQETNGGWSYAYEEVPSVVYTHAGPQAAEFPDLQYTIDVAVPGIALCQAYRASRDRRWLEAASRALEFFEVHIGRVPWGDHLIWRLHPEDDKTARSGTAVNYELWAGYFFACLASVADDAALAARTRGYAHDAVRYARRHLLPSGEIRYGDYVDEKRTAYASWDAYLLHEIGREVDSAEASGMAKKIALNLAETVLPNGALPNVSDYEEILYGKGAPRVHRHGIGPYPIRNYYQLYYVVAATLSGTESKAGLRALGFVLLNLCESAFGDLGRGYDGRGELDDRAGTFGADWFMFALAVLTATGQLTYSPRLRPGNRRERLLDAATSIQAAVTHRTAGKGEMLAIGQLLDGLAMVQAVHPRASYTEQIEQAAADLLTSRVGSHLLPLLRGALSLASSSALGTSRSRWATEVREHISGSHDDLVAELCGAAIDFALTHTKPHYRTSALGDIHGEWEALGDATHAERRAALLVALAVLGAAEDQWLDHLRTTASLVWQGYFLASGRGFLDTQHRDPMTASLASEFAFAFGILHRLTGDVAERARQEAVTRYLLRNHRRFDFQFSDLPGAREASADATAAGYFAVAGLINDDLPPWARVRA